MGAAHQLWLLTIAACALVGWWLGVRPGSSFRSMSTTMSVLIVLMAALMVILALDGQGDPGWTIRRTALAAP